MEILIVEDAVMRTMMTREEAVGTETGAGVEKETEIEEKETEMATEIGTEEGISTEVAAGAETETEKGEVAATRSARNLLLSQRPLAQWFLLWTS
jgi:hypothetical protein